ncbi:MAG TPA: SRPBCC domain-containing protein [Flavisolibacter sp.]
MIETRQTNFTKDSVNKKIIVEREFDAPLAQVWRAWTEAELLDQWWAPRPWKTRTRSMDFREGGVWLYYMEGPEGEKQLCRVDYATIRPEQSFTGDDAFCDEAGNINRDFPVMHWQCHFSGTSSGTLVRVEITFDSEADMEKIIEMGFQEGFTAAHGNLDELLAR